MDPCTTLPEALPAMSASCLQRKLSELRKKLWKEAGPPPDLATRLFSERIMYLVRCGACWFIVCVGWSCGHHHNGLAWVDPGTPFICSSQGMPIDSSVAELLTAQLFVLVQEAPDPIYLYINSTGIAVRVRRLRLLGPWQDERVANLEGHGWGCTLTAQHECAVLAAHHCTTWLTGDAPLAPCRKAQPSTATSTKPLQCTA